MKGKDDKANGLLHIIMFAYFILVLLLILINRYLNRIERRRMQRYRELQEVEDVEVTVRTDGMNQTSCVGCVRFSKGKAIGTKI